MRSYIIYCPHLNRDIRGLLNRVPMPRIWTGDQTERGEEGCLECHQAIVRGAKHRGDRCVFVMEDDCFFTRAFALPTWNWQVQWAENHGYDVLVGGSTRTWKEKVVYQNGGHALIEVGSFCSAHCIVYFESSYDRVLQTVQPHDISIGEQGCRVLLTWPFVAVQQPSFSGILHQHVNYVPLYVAHEHRLGHALGLLEPYVSMPEY